MSNENHSRETIESKNISVCGQNVLVIETYPEDISQQCPGFITEYSKCGLSHPKLDTYRQCVVICNVGFKLLYIAYGLDIYVHAGISVSLCKEYISDLKNKGYKVVDKNKLQLNKKHIIVIGANESMNIEDRFWFYNQGSTLFTEKINALFRNVNLPQIISILNKHHEQEKKQKAKKYSRGQPTLVDFNFSIQNCTEQETSHDINMPKLSKLPQLIEAYDNESLAHVQLSMMTYMTKFLKSTLSVKEILGDRDRNKLFGGSIGEKIGHTNISFVSENCFEGNACGYKSQEQPFFNTHVDSLNSSSDKRYRYTAVMSSVEQHNDNYIFPFSIFYNRRGCETRCGYKLNIQKYLDDLKHFLNLIPLEDKTITDDLFIDVTDIERLTTLTSTMKIVLRENVLILHCKPHTNKHVQLSSFVKTIHCTYDSLTWWNYQYTIEYLFFVGLSCTPVTSWFSMQEIFYIYKKQPPTECLTVKLLEICKKQQGAIDRTTGHRYSPSAGRFMPMNYLYWSLKNLQNALKMLDDTENTSEIVCLIAKHPSKGGCYKIGHLSALEVITIYTLAGLSNNLCHATNAMICEGNRNTKFLEEKYGFSMSQRKHLLRFAQNEFPEYTHAILENVTCKMGQRWDNKMSHHCDTIFENQNRFFYY